MPSRVEGWVFLGGGSPRLSSPKLSPLKATLQYNLSPVSNLLSFTVCPSAVGDALVGQVVDFLGRPYTPASTAGEGAGSDALASAAAAGSSAAMAAVQPLGVDQKLPLLNGQPDMDSREQINEPLVTGIKVCARALKHVLMRFRWETAGGF